MSGPETATAERVAAVVVGVDGSPGAKDALRWALAEARLRKVPLRIVHAWTYGYVGGGYGYMGEFDAYSASGVDVPGEIQAAAEEVVERLISEVAGDFADVEIERLIIDGSPASALIGAVAAGDLLVVGSRGHGGFAGLLLGSVSHQCVNHAQCPVVVVRR